MKRIFAGSRGFIPTGPPKHIGPSKPLADIVEYGPARDVTIIVGQTKGMEPKNRAGACKRLPEQFSPAVVDREFTRIRAAQIGAEAVAATRRAGKGWYRGQPEESVAYQIAFIPTGSEKTYKQFEKNINRLSEAIAERFCQDGVLILRDDGRKRTVAEAKWSGRKR